MPCSLFCGPACCWLSVGSTIPGFCVLSGVCRQTGRKRHLTTRLYSSYTCLLHIFLFSVCEYICVCSLSVLLCLRVIWSWLYTRETAKKEAEQGLRGRQLELEQERGKIELRWRREELQQDNYVYDSMSATSKMKKKESWNRRRAKAPGNWADKRKFKSIWIAGKRLRKCRIKDASKNELQAEQIRWPNIRPSRPVSPNVVIKPPRNVTQDRIEKYFSACPKTTPLIQPGLGLFNATAWFEYS